MLLSPQQAYNIIVKQSEYLTANIPDFSGINVVELANYGFAVAKTESRSFNTDAKNSNSTAKGMMQIVDGTKQFIETKILKIPVADISKMFDPDYNCLLGVAYLAYQYKRYGDWRKAVIAYNQGSYNDGEAGQSYYATASKFYANTDFASLLPTPKYTASLFSGKINKNVLFFVSGSVLGIIILNIYNKMRLK